MSTILKTPKQLSPEALAEAEYHREITESPNERTRSKFVPAEMRGFREGYRAGHKVGKAERDAEVTELNKRIGFLNKLTMPHREIK